MMFSIILCWLLTSFVCAHFINNTLHDKKKHKISKMPTTAINASKPVSKGKDCVLQTNERDMSQIVDLTKSDFFNILDVRPIFSNSSSGQTTRDIQILLVNPIGREIIHTLDTEWSTFPPWTLTVGRETVELRIHESPAHCAENEHEKVYAFLTKSVFGKLASRMKESTNYRICYTFSNRSDRPLNGIHRTCMSDDFSTKLDRHDGLVFAAMLFLFSVYSLWLLFFLLSCSLFDMQYPKYYRLEDSLMSPSAILIKLFWEEKGRVVSFYRRSIIMVSLACLTRFCTPTPLVFQYSRFAVFYSVLSLPFSRFFMKPQTREQQNFERGTLDFRGFAGFIQCLTPPCKQKFWTISYFSEDGYSKCELTVKILKVLCFVCLHLCIFIPISLVLQSICLLCKGITTIHFLLYLGYMHSTTSLKTQLIICFNDFLTMTSLLILICHILCIMVFALHSFLLGVFLNIKYVIPHIAFVSILAFYCHSYWKSIEQKYFVLKRIVYEACRDSRVRRAESAQDHEQIETSDSQENQQLRSNERDKIALPVVSKEVYEQIRDQFLPYHTSIFHFIFRVLWSVVFSYSIFEILNVLYAFQISAVVQVITTASLGVIPHLFNTIDLKIGDEVDKAWEEKLHQNVKEMVEKLVAMDNARAKTVLMVKEDGDPCNECSRVVQKSD